MFRVFFIIATLGILLSPQLATAQDEAEFEMSPEAEAQTIDLIVNIDRWIQLQPYTANDPVFDAAWGDPDVGSAQFLAQMRVAFRLNPTKEQRARFKNRTFPKIKQLCFEHYEQREVLGEGWLERAMADCKKLRLVIAMDMMQEEELKATADR